MKNVNELHARFTEVRKQEFRDFIKTVDHLEKLLRTELSEEELTYLMRFPENSNQILMQHGVPNEIIAEAKNKCKDLIELFFQNDYDQYEEFLDEMEGFPVQVFSNIYSDLKERFAPEDEEKENTEEVSGKEILNENSKKEDEEIIKNLIEYMIETGDSITYGDNSKEAIELINAVQEYLAKNYNNYSFIANNGEMSISKLK